MKTARPDLLSFERSHDAVRHESEISAKTPLTPFGRVGRVCLVPRGRTQRTPKNGVPVAAGEGTEEVDKP